MWDRWEIGIALFIAIFVIAMAFGGLMWYIHEQAQEKKKDRFSRQEFEKRWVTDKRTKECWLEYQSTGEIPTYCVKDIK
tara:strand:- start:670 stop:906 length:237 start_codon:yes stop_codon:yes gene_type:complete